MSFTSSDLKGVNIFLVGMMGSGKSTIGKILAEKLGYQNFDTDDLVQQLAHQSISEIFEQSGEAEFRKFETQILAELSTYRRLVVSTGGGIILDPMNWSYLRHGLVVWLDVAPDLLWQRLKADNSRPLLKTSDPFAILKEKLEQRASLYQQADVTVRVQENLDRSDVCQKVIQSIQTKLAEQQQD